MSLAAWLLDTTPGLLTQSLASLFHHVQPLQSQDLGNETPLYIPHVRGLTMPVFATQSATTSSPTSLRPSSRHLPSLPTASSVQSFRPRCSLEPTRSLLQCEIEALGVPRWCVQSWSKPRPLRIPPIGWTLSDRTSGSVFETEPEVKVRTETLLCRFGRSKSKSEKVAVDPYGSESEKGWLDDPAVGLLWKKTSPTSLPTGSDVGPFMKNLTSGTPESTPRK